MNLLLVEGCRNYTFSNEYLIMNIFVLDIDPVKAAEYHCDKHYE